MSIGLTNKLLTKYFHRISDIFTRKGRFYGSFSNEMAGMSGGEIFHRMMYKHDVKHIFGYPGGSILPVFDGIYKSEFVEFILARHEQGAGHMAEGYARATGKPGVVLVSAGPGVTNVITVLADALADGLPIVVFTGQIPTNLIGTDAFQDVDIVAITRVCTKWNVMVTDVSDLPNCISDAFTVATSNRPGPVLVVLPKDISSAVLKRPISSSHQLTTSKVVQNKCPQISTFVKPLSRSSMRVIDLINNAKRPVIYAGNGIFGHPDGPNCLTSLANNGNIPVTTTLHALGSFDEKDPKALQMLGLHGSCYANLAMQNADLIIALGARFDNFATCNVSQFAPEAITAAKENRGGIIQFEILPKNIDKVVKATEIVKGDVTNNLKILLPHIKSSPRRDWFEQIKIWKENYPFYYEKANEREPIKPQQVIEELDRQTMDIKDRVIITTGVGNHQMWAAQFFRWTTPRQFVTSGGYGTMGFGLPSAIGVKIARPDYIVIDIDGDASFCMTAMELATAAEFNVGVKILLLNNSTQGMVNQVQHFSYAGRDSATIMKNPDFVKLAEAMGVAAFRITRVSEIQNKIKTFLEFDGPVILEAVVCKNEALYPFVPTGKALHEFVTHPHITERNKRQ